MSLPGNCAGNHTPFRLLGIVLDVKSVVLNLLFLSEWGERLIKPYTNKEDTSSELCVL